MRDALLRNGPREYDRLNQQDDDSNETDSCYYDSDDVEKSGEDEHDDGEESGGEQKDAAGPANPDDGDDEHDDESKSSSDDSELSSHYSIGVRDDASSAAGSCADEVELATGNPDSDGGDVAGGDGASRHRRRRRELTWSEAESGSDEQKSEPQSPPPPYRSDANPVDGEEEPDEQKSEPQTPPSSNLSDANPADSEEGVDANIDKKHPRKRKSSASPSPDPPPVRKKRRSGDMDAQQNSFVVIPKEVRPSPDSKSQSPATDASGAEESLVESKHQRRDSAEQAPTPDPDPQSPVAHVSVSAERLALERRNEDLGRQNKELRRDNQELKLQLDKKTSELKTMRSERARRAELDACGQRFVRAWLALQQQQQEESCRVATPASGSGAHNKGIPVQGESQFSQSRGIEANSARSQLRQGSNSSPVVVATPVGAPIQPHQVNIGQPVAAPTQVRVSLPLLRRFISQGEGAKVKSTLRGLNESEQLRMCGPNDGWGDLVMYAVENAPIERKCDVLTDLHPFAGKRYLLSGNMHIHPSLIHQNTKLTALGLAIRQRDLQMVKLLCEKYFQVDQILPRYLGGDTNSYGKNTKRILQGLLRETSKEILVYLCKQSNHVGFLDDIDKALRGDTQSLAAE